jgi:beta-fructofuranosidase
MPAKNAKTALNTMPISNRAGQIVCAFKPGDNTCGLELLNGIGGAPLFSIEYNGTKVKPLVIVGDKMLPLSPNADGISTMELWIDGSVVEIFVDSKQALTARNYQPSSGHLFPKWTGPAALKSITVSGVTPISSDRLTS